MRTEQLLKYDFKLQVAFSVHHKIVRLHCSRCDWLWSEVSNSI